MALYLSEIVSVAGKPGLHKVIGKRPTGLIVESLDKQKKRFPTNLTQKVSFLSDISMYTYEGDERLPDVLKSLHEQVSAGLELVSKKNSGDEVRDFFRKVLENFDEDQVYVSDILKLVAWYDILKDHVDFNDLEKEEEEGDSSKDSGNTDSKSKAAQSKPKSSPKASTKAKGSVKKSGNLKSGKS